MGKDLYRACTPEELAKMETLLAGELKAGAFGLSTGLEYEQGHFATTEEIIELSKVAAATGGFYISHVRDEGDKVFDSYDEILRIGREAKIPVEITHIKLGSTPVWHLAATRMPGYFATAQREHIDLKADVYPYTYWHSTIRVLVTDRDFFNPDKVAKALADNGGASAIRLAHYVPEPAMAGKTLDQIAAAWKITPVEAYMRIVKATEAEVDSHRATGRHHRNHHERGRCPLVYRPASDYVQQRWRTAWGASPRSGRVSARARPIRARREGVAAGAGDP